MGKWAISPSFCTQSNCFPNPPLLANLFQQYRLNEIPDKQKTKLMWQSYSSFLETKKQCYMSFLEKILL